MKQILFLNENENNKAISSPETLFKKIKRIKIDYEQENYILFCLNNQNELIHHEILFKGTFNSCIISPNIIFRKALLNKAIKIILAHNHPSDNLEPSREDLGIHEILKEDGELLELRVLDSIIFNKKEFLSMNNYRKGKYNHDDKNN